MFVLLLFAFIVVPVVEIYVIVEVADGLGWGNTILILILDSLIGAWLVRWQGLTVIGRAQNTMNRGELPTRELFDGVLILMAGALLLTPGFVTDGIGVAFLLPPVRAGMRAWLNRSWKRRMVRHEGTFRGTTGFGGTHFHGRWIEAEEIDPEQGRDRPE